MGDEEKREARRFEPPPWEKEAFEAFARRKAEERQALEASGDASATPKQEPKPAAPAAAVDERRVQAMLLELGREEKTSTSHIGPVSRVASVVTGIAGIGMVIGGISILQAAGTKSVAVMGGGALSVFGLCFAGMAVWVWVRSNR
jgi:hypothetical protein